MMGFFDLFKGDPDVEMMQRNNDVNGLIKALKHNQTIIREKATKALESLNDERAIQALREDEKRKAEERAIQALREGGIIQMGIFDFLWGSHEPNIVEMERLKYVDGLVVALKHRQTLIREKAAKALGRIGDERAIDPLIECLNDQSEAVRISAAEALKEYDNPPFDRSKISAVLQTIDNIMQHPKKKLVSADAQYIRNIERIRQKEQSAQKIGTEKVQSLYSSGAEKMNMQKATCDKAIHYMKKFKEYENLPGGMPSSAKNELYDFVKCIDEMLETAIKKKHEGIIVPKEIQIIKTIYEMRSCYAEIVIASRQALEKFGGYF
jgi:hypothetical protein